MISNTIGNFIASAIFSGTLIMTLCMLIVHLFKLRIAKIDKQVLVTAVNTLLLLGAMIYTIMWAAEPFIAYYSGGEYEQYTFTDRFVGPYWWAGFALLTRSVLLPQILWIRRVRTSFISTVIIISVWAIIGIPATLIHWRTLWDTTYLTLYLERLVVYWLLLTGVYLVLKRKSLIRASGGIN